MTLIAYVSPGLHADNFRGLLASEGIQSVSADSPVINSPDRIYIVNESFARMHTDSILSSLGVLIITPHPANIELYFPPELFVDISLPEIAPARVLNLIRVARMKQQIISIQNERDSYSRRLKELNNIGVALTTERDLLKLGELILKKSREITSADAGTLYLVESSEENGDQLRVKIIQNDSMEVGQYEEFVIPMTKESIAGYVATTGEAVNIPDVYLIPQDSEFKFNRLFDEDTGYRTISNLAVPMQNPRGEITGVIQLINRKTNFQTRLTPETCQLEVRPFDQNDEELVSSLASQAAVSLDNSRLIRSIENLFEGFVTAAVTAIESRDPTTSGHSFRVADLTVGLASIVDKTTSGSFRNLSFSAEEVKEMRYAALLHDFGKVGVRENVLVKAKKLYPMQLDMIRQRISYYKKAWEADHYRSMLNLLIQSPKVFEQQNQILEEALKNRLNSLEDYLRFIAESNEPTVLPEGNFERLMRIAKDQSSIPPGVEEPLLNEEEIRLLSIRKGSLNDTERREIESHVTHTYLFLSKIPWTTGLKEVPRIAYGHHEKLNGSGYPNNLGSEEIPVQTRMMTISDIYDALTASDRPYKKAVPTAKALDILASEVKSGQVDSELFQLFLDAKVYLMTSRI